MKKIMKAIERTIRIVIEILLIFLIISNITILLIIKGAPIETFGVIGSKMSAKEIICENYKYKGDTYRKLINMKNESQIYEQMGR